MRELIKKADEGDVSPEFKETLKINHQSELNSDQVKAIYTKMFENDSTDQQTLVTALFDE